MNPWREAWADFVFEWRKAGPVARIVAVVVSLGAFLRLCVETIPTSDFSLRGLRDDLRYGWRRLRHSPGFTVIAVLTLAVGIGANTALFSLVNGLVLVGVPGAATSGVVGIAVVGPDTGGGPLTLDQFRSVQESGGHAFATAAAWRRWRGAVSGAGQADAVMGEIVSSDYFSALSVAPVAGVFFGAADEVPGHTRVVISERLWRRWFDGSHAAIGATLQTGSWSFEIAGVAPDTFRGTSLPSLMRSDVWFSFGAADRLAPSPARPPDVRDLNVLARLAPSITQAQADAWLSTLVNKAQVASSPAPRLSTVPLIELVMPGQFRTVGIALGTAVLVLSGLVLVIACANVTNLLLARSAARSMEIAVRLANGATPHRIFRLVSVEVGLVVVLASAVGWVMAHGVAAALSVWVLPSVRGVSFAPAVSSAADPRVFAYMITIGAVAMCVAGWMPARRAARLSPTVMIAASGGSAWASRRGTRLRTVLVSTQVGISSVLLVVAGLFVRSSLVSLQHHPGYDTSRGAVVSLDLELHGIGDAEGLRYLDRALAAASSVPGVDRVALYDVLPVGTENNRDELIADGRPPLFGDRRGLTARFSYVTGEFFDMVRLPLVRGRVFRSEDRVGAPLVTVINERLAARLWPGEDPIGKRVVLQRRQLTMEVVGVVGDVDDHWPDVNWRAQPHAPYFFVSGRQLYKGETNILAQGSGDSAALVAPLHAAVRSVNTSIAVFGSDTLQGQAGLWLLPTRIAGIALGALGLAGWVIALVGLYGVMSYLVGQRTREIGIRIALGAAPGRVQQMVLSEAIRMMLLGAGPGLLVAALGASALERLLFGIAPYDPTTFVLVPALLFLVGAAATWAPARRAALVDPNIALRQQ